MASEQTSSKFLYFKPRNGTPLILDFDPKSVRLAPPEQKQGSQKLIAIKYLYNGVEIPFKLQFPKMRCPFELDYPNFNETDAKKHKTFSLSFHSEEYRDDLKAFRRVITDLDRIIIDTLADNSKEWFPSRGNRAKSREMIEENYGGSSGSLIKDGRNPVTDKVYPDRIDVKVPVRNGVMMTKFFDEQQNSILDETEIHMQHGEARMIGLLSQLWVVQGKYYPKFHAQQVQIFPPDEIEAEFSIVDEKDYGDESGEFEDDKLAFAEANESETGVSAGNKRPLDRDSTRQSKRKKASPSAERC